MTHKESLLLLICLLSGAKAFYVPESPLHPPFRQQRECRSLFQTQTDKEERNAEASRNVDVSTTRRKLLALLGSGALYTGSQSADAYYKKEFPSELDTSNGYLDGRERKLETIREREFQRTAPIAIGRLASSLSSLLWGSALWFLSGSRSNPLVNPLANVFYNDQDQTWLKDRNDGLFSDIPVLLYGVLVVVFVFLGFGADQLVTALAEGERNISLQLAGVSLISGATLEIGRIASGEKRQTRAESDRDTQLEQEFEEFAMQRLKQGGNCHRSEVVKAFRRYYGKYRTDNEQYPLVDLEIEQLVRSWCRIRGIEMTSAGFLKGLQINTDADAFVKR